MTKRLFAKLSWNPIVKQLDIMTVGRCRPSSMRIGSSPGLMGLPGGATHESPTFGLPSRIGVGV